MTSKYLHQNDILELDDTFLDELSGGGDAQDKVSSATEAVKRAVKNIWENPITPFFPGGDYYGFTEFFKKHQAGTTGSPNLGQYLLDRFGQRK